MDGSEQDTEDEKSYLEAMKELEDLFPPWDQWVQLARDHPPPQEWFDEDFDPGIAPDDGRSVVG